MTIKKLLFSSIILGNITLNALATDSNEFAKKSLLEQMPHLLAECKKINQKAQSLGYGSIKNSPYNACRRLARINEEFLYSRVINGEKYPLENHRIMIDIDFIDNDTFSKKQKEETIRHFLKAKHDMLESVQRETERKIDVLNYNVQFMSNEIRDLKKKSGKETDNEK